MGFLIAGSLAAIMFILIAIFQSKTEKEIIKNKKEIFVLGGTLFFVTEDDSIVYISKDKGWRLVEIKKVNYFTNGDKLYNIFECEDASLLS